MQQKIYIETANEMHETVLTSLLIIELHFVKVFTLLNRKHHRVF